MSSNCSPSDNHAVAQLPEKLATVTQMQPCSPPRLTDLSVLPVTSLISDSSERRKGSRLKHHVSGHSRETAQVKRPSQVAITINQKNKGRKQRLISSNPNSHTYPSTLKASLRLLPYEGQLDKNAPAFSQSSFLQPVNVKLVYEGRGGEERGRTEGRKTSTTVSSLYQI